MVNSADLDHLASSEAKWSGSTLFAKAGYIRIQQDKGWHSCPIAQLLAHLTVDQGVASSVPPQSHNFYRDSSWDTDFYVWSVSPFCCF